MISMVAEAGLPGAGYTEVILQPVREVNKGGETCHFSAI
jgi:hypothetical protein